MRNHAAMLAVMMSGCYLASAATYYVVPVGTPGTPTPNYLSWDTAATSIQDAVSVATNGGLVLVTNGTYDLLNQIVITNPITVRSFNNGAVDVAGTIINGNYPTVTNRCAYFSATAVGAVMDGFTLSNGYASASSLGGHGGGIYLLKGIVTNCVVTGNQAPTNGNGGGIYMGAGATVTCSTITRNLATNNIAGYGGGVYLSSGGVVTNCLISLNCAGFCGGAVSIVGGYGWLINCRLFNNEVKQVAGTGNPGGGGVYGNSGGGGGTIVGCQIVSNTISGVKTPYGAGVMFAGVIRDSLVAYNTGAGYGGGVNGGTLISNCVIRNNSGGNGGGVATPVLVVNCMIANNSSAAFHYGTTFRNCLVVSNASGLYAFQTGGGTYQNCTIVSNSNYGIQLGYGANILTPANIENCVIYNNSVKNWGSTTNVFVAWTNNCTTPMPTGTCDVANITNNPSFVDVAAGNFRLKRTSPCINQGLNRGWMSGVTDLDGVPRIQEDTVDIGAYELVPWPGTLIYVK